MEQQYWVERFLKINKRRGWNKRIGWKILQKSNGWKGNESFLLIFFEKKGQMLDMCPKTFA